MAFTSIITASTKRSVLPGITENKPSISINQPIKIEDISVATLTPGG
ncbi:hypothetical protein [Candidatus Cardinium hertigii]|nr:hypothetical protein [Candidatus Cardinium hertigii]